MKRIFALTLFCLCMFTVCALADIHVDEPTPEDWTERDLLRLTVFPTYTNDAMLMECGGESMLIDGGYGQWYDKMRQALADRGYGEHITYVLNTHPHDDHIETQTELLRRGGLTCDAFLSPFAEDYGNKLHKIMVSVLHDKGIAYRQLLNGETFAFGGASIDCASWLDAVAINDRSLQMHVHFGNTTLLLTGDLTGKGQHHYLETLSAEDLQSTVLKAPHHSITHMVVEYLETVNPEFVILINEKSKVSKSENQLTKRDIPHLYNTNTTIVLETDGNDWYITSSKGWN